MQMNTNYLDFTIGNFKLTDKLAGFDLDSTIIKTKSKKKFPVDDDDWVFFCDAVVSKMRSLVTDGYCIVIVTNQRGLTKTGTDGWIKKINNIGKQLNVPLRCLASLENDMYRKPCVGLFKLLANQFSKFSKFSTDSFYCGDAAGRKGDFSDTDYKFAVNCGLKFSVPERLFFDENVVLPKIKYIDFNVGDVGCDVKENRNEMVIMVGYPGSGKSTFVKKYLPNYVYVNRDTLKTKAKCLSAAEKALVQGRSVVIDNTNPDVESRKVYIDMAKEAEFHVTVIEIDCPIEVAMHNANYRMCKSNGKSAHIPDLVYRKYKKNYVKPSEDEGIDRIVTVKNSIPDDPEYRMYYY
jgi:bifunctional polynucleotide phosphatase/kinase